MAPVTTLIGWDLVPAGPGVQRVADGRRISSRLYIASVRWLGSERWVVVADMGSPECILGFKLLRNTRVTLHSDTVEVETI